jgi:glycosyltransferase involved in cell wall biosynthesis
VVSTPLKSHLVSLGIPEGHVVVMPNGANPKAFQSKIDGGRVRIKYGMQNKLVLGFVGILRPWHGLEMLIDVFNNLKPQECGLHLFVIGDGPIQPALEALVVAKNLKESVTFTGRVPHEEMEEHVAAIDIAISPRATFYASPMKILEYMAMAKAVVAPDMENIRDIVDHGYDGILFEPENSNSLEKRLLELVENQAMRDELGRRARKKIENRLNWIQNARHIVEIVRDLV